MLKKIILSLLIIVTLTSQATFSYQKAHAAGVSTMPGYLDEAYATVVVGALTVGAAAVHANEFMTQNLDYVREAAKNAWNEYSPEVKQNFIDSMNAAGDRYSIAWSTVSSFLNNLTLDKLDSHFNTISYDQAFLDTVTFTKEYSNEYGWAKAHVYTSDATLALGYRLSLNGYSGNNDYWFSVNSYFKTVTLQVGSSKIKEIALSNAEIQSAISRTAALSTPAGVLTMLSSLGAEMDLQLDGVSVGTAADGDVYNSIKEYVGSTDLADLDNIYLPQPEVYTPDNIRLNVDSAAGTLALPDGTIYTGDYTWRIPNTGVRDIDGVAIPTTTTGTGDIVDIRTGEVVIPAETEVPPGTIPGEGDFKNPTKSIIWTPLVMSADALKTKFPFSLPWDLLRQLGIFDVKPETPVFHINIQEYLKVGETDSEGEFLGITVPMKFDLDLNMFNPVAAIVRWFTRIIWIIGLIFVLRKLLPE